MNTMVQLHHFSHSKARLTLGPSCFLFVASNIHPSTRILPGHCTIPGKVVTEPFPHCDGYCPRPALGMLEGKECAAASTTLSFEWLTLLAFQHVVQDTSCLHHFLHPCGFGMHSRQKKPKPVRQDAESIFRNSTCPGEPETICIQVL